MIKWFLYLLYCINSIGFGYWVSLTYIVNEKSEILQIILCCNSMLLLLFWCYLPIKIYKWWNKLESYSW
jgi:hypothetical protein